MGGTTAKAALLEDGLPARTSEYEVGAAINPSSRLVKGGGHAIKLPFIDVSEIGAGGGSIVEVDHGARPRRADERRLRSGAGLLRTRRVAGDLTDALVVLGLPEPDAARRR